VPLRLLTAAAAVELLTLVVLLVNLGTVHVPVVATVLGPLHGCAYLTAIVGAAVRTGLSRVTLLCFVPGVGASLAVVLLRSSGRGPVEGAP
jgi:hypothetical protein